MRVQTFVVDSVAEALTQIRSQLGPEAVVLNVRRLPAEGFARLWRPPRVEVLACVPEQDNSGAGLLAELRQEIDQIKQRLLSPPPADLLLSPTDETTRPVRPADGGWRIAAVLENAGVLPLYVERMLEQMEQAHGRPPPGTLAEELTLTRDLLRQSWRSADHQPPSGGLHVFVGPAGTGKTTSLCKWLTQLVLVTAQPCRVWRLDGRTANTAESLSVYGEILGVPVERSRPVPGSAPQNETWFVDLPGVGWRDPDSISELSRQLSDLRLAQVHLVLNAAYEVPLLLAQARSFAPLPVQDLILTHLDEESRWGKLWNFVLGTNYSLRFLSAGQNIPGSFLEASADLILARSFAR